jgi:excisionase family DNA binding protein
MMSERLMTLVELADMLAVPLGTLYQWRHRGEGPPGYRIGRHVRYRRGDVEAWLETQADQHRHVSGF